MCERDLVIKRQGDPTFGNVHLCKIHTLTAHHNTKISFSTAGCCVNDGELLDLAVAKKLRKDRKTYLHIFGFHKKKLHTFR